MDEPADTVLIQQELQDDCECLVLVWMMSAREHERPRW